MKWVKKWNLLKTMGFICINRVKNTRTYKEARFPGKSRFTKSDSMELVNALKQYYEHN